MPVSNRNVTPIRKIKEDALRLEYIEYHKWRAIIQTEVMVKMRSGVTYKYMSARTGLCISTISNLACGKTVLPRMDKMYRMLKFLGYKLYITKVHQVVK